MRSRMAAPFDVVSRSADSIYQGIDAVSPVVLGQRKDAALLGTLTLESLGLVLNPFERRLTPMRMLLARQS
jgi:hypothetical protein